jgi:hypothetical protein
VAGFHEYCAVGGFARSLMMIVLVVDTSSAARLSVSAVALSFATAA